MNTDNRWSFLTTYNDHLLEWPQERKLDGLQPAEQVAVAALSGYDGISISYIDKNEPEYEELEKYLSTISD